MWQESLQFAWQAEFPFSKLELCVFVFINLVRQEARNTKFQEQFKTIVPSGIFGTLFCHYASSLWAFFSVKKELISRFRTVDSLK